MNSLTTIDKRKYITLKEFTKPSGFRLLEKVSKKRFFEMGFQIIKIQDNFQWYIGDWINSVDMIEGEYKGDVLKEIQDLIGYSIASLTTYSKVCSKFPIEKRTFKLSFNHYTTVRRLEESVVFKFLEKSEKENWSVVELRQAADKYLLKQIGRKARREKESRRKNEKDFAEEDAEEEENSEEILNDSDYFYSLSSDLDRIRSSITEFKERFEDFEVSKLQKEVEQFVINSMIETCSSLKEDTIWLVNFLKKVSKT